MKLEIHIPEYDSRQGLELEWGDSNILRTEIFENYVKITGNRDGLIDFAIHLLTLAQDNVPSGYHVHYDKWNRLQDESNIEILVQKL